MIASVFLFNERETEREKQTMLTEVNRFVFLLFVPVQFVFFSRPTGREGKKFKFCSLTYTYNNPSNSLMTIKDLSEIVVRWKTTLHRCLVLIEYEYQIRHVGAHHT